MRKMLARNEFGLSQQTYRNEEQFNNYFVTKHRPRMSLDFEKHIGRNSSLHRYAEDP
jgi:hypothetical protein